jgi:hypothetical protein
MNVPAGGDGGDEVARLELVDVAERRAVGGAVPGERGVAQLARHR